MGKSSVMTAIPARDFSQGSDHLLGQVLPRGASERAGKAWGWLVGGRIAFVAFCGPVPLERAPMKAIDVLKVQSRRLPLRRGAATRPHHVGESLCRQMSEQSVPLRAGSQLSHGLSTQV